MIDLTDYRVLREGAGLTERRDLGLLRLAGRDRASFLHGLVTNDIRSLAPGAGCYAAFLTPQGRLVTDVWVYELGDGLLLVLPRRTTAPLRERLEACVFTEDVRVDDLSDEHTILGVYGPAAREVVGAALGPDAARAARSPCGGARVETAVGPVVLAVADEIGVAAVWCVVASAAAGAAGERLRAAGAVEVRREALETVRIESGRPAFDADMDETTMPLEVGLETRAISATKGCYVGQEVVVRVRDRGHGRVARRLVGLLVDGDRAPARGDAVRLNDREAGRVTSVAESPALGRIVALAIVYRDAADPETRVTIVRDDRSLSATIVALPFVSGS